MKEPDCTWQVTDPEAGNRYDFTDIPDDNPYAAEIPYSDPVYGIRGFKTEG